jgi:hypothetical protein
MQKHGGFDPDYATVIFGGAGVAVSKMQLKVFDEMLAAGEVMPTAVMYNALIRGRREESNGRHDPNASRPRSSRRWKYEYGVANQKEKPQSKDSGRA